jgi:drug/metabolite transporter (DMT)-like permease
LAQHRVRLIVAFAAVYLIWGSTYLAIRWAIDTIPPFLMAGGRYLTAGSVLYLWSRVRGGPRPTRRNWRDAAIVGGLLLLGGNGGVVWAEQTVPSGLAALLVALEPLWVVLLDWVRPGGTRPRAGEIAGLVLGFGGVVLLIGPGHASGAPHVNPVGAVVLLVATLSWASGSLYSRHADVPPSPFLSTGMNMLAGGALLLLAGTVSGQWATLHPAAVTLRSLLALLFLIVFGAIVGFTAYLWLLRNANLATVSTYAYVNPVVAVILGWALASEAITLRIVVAAAVIVGSVVLITLARTSAFTYVGRTLRRAASPAKRRPEAA